MYEMYYEDFLVKKDVLAEGKPVEVFLRDENMAWAKYKVIIRSSKTQTADKLYLIHSSGKGRVEGEWYVEILEKIEEEPPSTSEEVYKLI